MTPSTSRWRRSAVLFSMGLFSVGLALTAALAGCGSSGSSSSSGTGAGGAAPAPARNDGKQAADAAGAPAQGGGAAADKPAQLPATTRSIVYTGSITVRVDDVNGAANELIAQAARAGGMVGGDQRTMDAGKSTATLTLRIPADKFSKALDDISHVGKGKEQSRQVSTQDVTANVVDLAARIQAQQASVDRVRALLAKAQTIGEITSVEGELSRREADLESLKGQQRSLDDLTALSTIAATLLGPDAAVPARPKAAQGGFLAGLTSGWHAFAAAIGVVLTVLGAVLPFVLVLGVPVWLVYLWQRRRRAAQLSSPTAAPKAESEA